VSDRPDGDSAARNGLAALAGIAVAIACCSALPLIAALAGSIAVGALAGIAAAAAAVVLGRRSSSPGGAVAAADGGRPRPRWSPHRTAPFDGLCLLEAGNVVNDS
jgi:hypothetical protein